MSTHAPRSRALLPFCLSILCGSNALAGELRGKILAGDRPAAGVTVSAVPYETPFEEARREARRAPRPKPLAATLTGADGSFVLSLAPDAAGGVPRSFKLLAEGGGVAPVATASVFDASETLDVGDITAPAAAKLAGKVVTAGGSPVAGAEVTIAGGGGFFADRSDVVLEPRSTVTGADGRFRFDDAAASGNRVSVEAKGFAPVQLASVRAGALARAVVLAPGASLSGAVKKTDRRTPAAGALVRFEGKATTRWVEAGADGSFSLADLPTGTGGVVANAGDDGLGELRGITLPDWQGKKLTVVLAPPAGLEGRVVDAKTGGPVPRARIAARAGSAAVVGRSGPDGRYRIQGLPPHKYRLEADEPRYVPYARDDLRLLAGETKKVDLPLAPGASLAGRVVDENGAPIAGARGELARSGETGLAALMREMRAGERVAFRTAPDGSFQARRLFPGDNQRLSVTHPEFERRTVAGLSLPAGSAKTGLVVVMRRGLTLTGRVRDLTGQPVAGSEVELMQARTFRGGRGGVAAQMTFVGPGDRRTKATTGADGRFELHGLLPGEYTLTARKTGFADGTVDPVKIDAEAAASVEVTLGPGASISGAVLRSSGEGAEGYIVRARGRDRGGEGSLGGVGSREPTGPDGAFTIEGLAAGETYDLQLLGPDGLGPRKEGVAAPAIGVEVLVPGLGKIAGKVVDAQSGAPVMDFEVSKAPDRGSGGTTVMIRVGRRAGRPGSEDRKVVHSEDGSFLLTDVPAGAWEVSVEAQGYQPARVDGVVVKEGATTDGVEVKASHGSAIIGRVSDAGSGRPLPGVLVSADPPGSDLMPRLALGFDASGTETDADGRFTIGGLAPGRYHLTVRHPDYAEASEFVEVKDAPATADIRLFGGGVVAGSVTTEGRRPVGGAEVVLTPAGEAGFGRMVLAGGAGTVSDETGRFRFDHLSAGRYSVTASLRGHSSSPADVVLQAGESRQDLALSLAAGATIHGMVSGLPPTLKGGVNVNVNGPDGYFASARTGADGLFEISGAPAGAINLQATEGDLISGSTRTARTQLVIAEGETDVQAEILFEPGLTLSGTVTRAAEPVPDAFVSASAQGGGRSAAARTDPSGAYRLEGLQEGTYMVTAAPSHGGSLSRQTVKLVGDTTLDLAIPVARLAGTVVEAGSGMALADAVVELGSAEPGAFFALRSTSDSNGRFSLEDIEPKAYTLTVRKSGFQFEQRQVTASEQGPDDLRLELRRGEGIGILARDGIYGVPLRGLTARVLDAQATPVFTGSVALDSQGRGEIPSLKPGRYSVLLDSSGYAAALLEAVNVPAPTLQVALTPGGAVEIHASPEALAHGPLRCTLLTASGAPYPFSVFGPSGQVVVTTPVRRLENVAPGRYSLAVDGGVARPLSVSEGGTTVVEVP